MILWVFLLLFANILSLCAEKLPLYMTADRVVYDEKLDTLEAFGNVEISQFFDKNTEATPLFFQTQETDAHATHPSKSERFLRADHIIYHRKTQKIIATGNVIAIDEDQNVLWSEKVDIDETFDNGFIDSVRLLLSNHEGRLTAEKGDRKDGNITTFHKITYSPCEVCQTKPKALWQIRSKNVTHDHQEHTMVYRDVFLDIFDVPVLYSPYFYHADPTVKRKSGFLMPTYGQSSDLGTIVKVPYFFVLGPHQDLTLNPIITTKQGPIMAAEYRRRFKLGDFSLSGSLTQSRHLNRQIIRETQNNPTPPKTRFHLFARGRFELTDYDLVTFDLKRASDTTYLRRYNIVTNRQVVAQDKNLTSFAKWERFKGNHYFGLKSFAFQTDRPKLNPYVFPLAQYLYKSDPGTFGQIFGFEGNLLTLSRRLSPTNVAPKASTRGILKGSFYLPYTTQTGHLFEVDTQMRGDLYAIHDYATTFQRSHSNYTTGRFMPTAALTWRYPLARMMGSGQYLIEPIAQIVASPSGLNPGKIPNEDSRFSELDDLNLFFIDRMNGFDRTDSGRRFVYGVNTGFYGAQGRRVVLFLGQSYRLNKRGVDLIGDHKKASDYVTRLQCVPVEWLRLHYRGRFDNKKVQNRFSEVGANFGYPLLNLNTSYIYVDKKETPSGQPINQINWQVMSKITDEWSLGFTRTQNLSRIERSARAYMASAVYENDCFQMSLGFYHTGYHDRDIKPDTGALLQFNFKNLGSFKPLSSSSFPTVSFRNIGY